MAEYFFSYLSNCKKGLHIWGGESSVKLPKSPGRGGRNQQLALLMAEKIKNKDIVFLSAGTDGTDGPTDDAGGLVDGNTISLGINNNLDLKAWASLVIILSIIIAPMLFKGSGQKELKFQKIDNQKDIKFNYIDEVKVLENKNISKVKKISSSVDEKIIKDLDVNVITENNKLND